MAENDIYKSKERYIQLIARVEEFTKKPKKNDKRKYYCKNPKNLKYFRILINHFDAKDLSYIRRKKVLQVMRLITFILEKDLGECTREDINSLVAYSHTICKTVHSKKDFLKDLKAIWRTILPEKDLHGRVDETLIPYVVRHLSGAVDKSKEKLRNDRISYEEFNRTVHNIEYFSYNPFFFNKLTTSSLSEYSTLGNAFTEAFMLEP